VAGSLKEQVQDRVAQVRAAHAAAVQALGGKVWKTEAVKHSLYQLKTTVAGAIDRWADKGAAALDKVPKKWSWNAWLQGGTDIMTGVADLRGEGETASLAALSATVDDVQADIKRLGKKTAQVVEAAGEAVGKTAGAIAGPLTLPLALLAVTAIVGLVIYVKAAK